MAYAPNPSDQNAPQDIVDPTKQLPSTSSTGGGATGTPQGSTAIPNATKAPPVQDLHAYLTANAPQAVQMGQNIAGNLTQQAQTVAGDVTAAQNAVDQQVQASNITPNASLVSQAAANPMDFVQNPDNVAAFQAQENAKYTGPSYFEQTPEFSNVNAEVNKAVNEVPDITKAGGVDQLVRGQETNPTLGMENLDTLLLQGNPDAMAPIQGALPAYQQLNPQLNAATAAEDAAIQKVLANNQAAAGGVQDAFLTGPNAVAPAFQGNLNKELQTDTDQTRAYNDALNALIAEYSKDPSWAFTPGLQDLVTGAMEQQPNLAQAATPQDVQTEKALEVLLGGNYNPLFSSAGVTPYAPGNPADIENQIKEQLATTKRRFTPTSGILKAS